MNSESCILCMIAYLMLFLLLSKMGTSSLIILNSTAFIIWTTCLTTKSKHLRKKIIITGLFCTVLNFFYYDSFNDNIGFYDNKRNIQKEYLLDVVFSYLPTENNSGELILGKIISSVPNNDLLKEKFINVKFNYKNMNIKPLKRYSILAIINKSDLFHPIIYAQNSRILNQIKTPFQKLNFKLQCNLNSKLETKAGGFGWAMLCGSKEFLDSNLLKSAAITGTMHLFAVSGLHIGFFYFFINFCLKPLSRWLLLALPIKLFLCLAYVSFLNFPESGIRALLMISVYELSRVVFGKQKGVTIFCISALILLLYYPSTIYSLSCQLSFTVVLFIIFIMRDCPLSNKLETHFLKNFKVYPLISLAAAAGSSLLIFDYFNYFSYVCLLTNLLITPLISLFYTLNILHFICLIFINYSCFNFIHELVFLCIYNIINNCTLLSSYFPKQVSSEIMISNVWHLVIFLLILFSFCLKFRWIIRFYLISIYYICFFLCMFVR